MILEIFFRLRNVYNVLDGKISATQYAQYRVLHAKRKPKIITLIPYIELYIAQSLLTYESELVRGLSF